MGGLTLEGDEIYADAVHDVGGPAEAGDIEAIPKRRVAAEDQAAGAGDARASQGAAAPGNYIYLMRFLGIEIGRGGVFRGAVGGAEGLLVGVPAVVYRADDGAVAFGAMLNAANLEVAGIGASRFGQVDDELALVGFVVHGSGSAGTIRHTRWGFETANARRRRTFRQCRGWPASAVGGWLCWRQHRRWQYRLGGAR